jgi:hypothetical protein
MLVQRTVRNNCAKTWRLDFGKRDETDMAIGENQIKQWLDMHDEQAGS